MATVPSGPLQYPPKMGPNIVPIGASRESRTAALFRKSKFVLSSARHEIIYPSDFLSPKSGRSPPNKATADCAAAMQFIMGSLGLPARFKASLTRTAVLIAPNTLRGDLGLILIPLIVVMVGAVIAWRHLFCVAFYEFY